MLFWEAKHDSAFDDAWIIECICFSSRQAQTFVNDGFIDAIKAYDDKDSSLDKAVDDLQKDVSIFYFASTQALQGKIIVC